MAIKRIDENPSISDSIIFDILTPDTDGCFIANPYKVDNIKIFYVERSFASSNQSEYEDKIYNPDKLAAAERAEAVACASPTDKNIATAKKLRDEAENTASLSTFYFDEARSVQITGSENFPAWLSSDTENAFIKNISEDSEGNTQYGHFEYEWDPKGMREGDYFICWTWTPLPAGESLSAHIRFSLMGNTLLTTSIPTHFTVPHKYEILLERYLPEMFKELICDEDLTPDVLDKFNKSVAGGFTVLEDLANQIVDLQDANSTHEALLPLLGNIFDLKLKTSDPTLWRRQIKQAIPLFKKKGTLEGLTEALDQAGIQLVKFTKLWQVVSKYTWQEAFLVSDETDFILSKVALSLDLDNFELSIRLAGEENYTELTSDYVIFDTVDGITTMSWVGNTLSTGSIELAEGDIIKVLYKYNDVPSPTEQTIENYIRSLPLADQRDEIQQEYPLKNWNVRVIEEDDALFDLVIPTRHPYYDKLFYGKVRQEFPYSENIYNMESYNGCCIGSTAVVTEKGLKKIQDITDDKLILTELGFRKFEGLANQGKKPTLKIKTKLGRELVVTPNHRFKIIDNEGNIKWKQAVSLCPDDYIMGKRGIENLEKNKGIDKDIWYLAGFVYGDGVRYKNKITWLVANNKIECKQFIENTLTYYNAKFSKKCNEDMYMIRSSEIQMPILAKILPKYSKKGKWKQYLPSIIWTSGEEQMCSFLSGLFDTDGGIQKGRPMVTTKWKTLAKDVQRLLLLLGIISSVASFRVPYKGKKRRYYRVRIMGSVGSKLFFEKINFKMTNKILALEGGYFSTNVKGKEQRLLGADRVVIPHATNIIRSIFPVKKRISINKPNKRGREEKRLLALIDRVKQINQQYYPTIPDNIVSQVLEKAEIYGNKNYFYEFLKNYVEQGWFFDKIQNIQKNKDEIVYDPLNVEQTASYVSEGLISHNSLRNSKEPCDIDKNFYDSCSYCQSSKFNIDLEIENLSNDRILEAQDVIREFVPFHAVLHSLNFIGGINEFIQSPVEEIEVLIQYNLSENVLSGNAQTLFSRVMHKGLTTEQITRDMLASSQNVVALSSGIAYNDSVVIFCPEVRFDRIGLNVSDNVLEILSPSLNAGSYSLSEPDKNTAVVSGLIIQPIITAPFTFRLSNIIYTATSTNITQDDIFNFSDAEQNFGLLGVKTQWDVENDTLYTGGPWKVDIPAYAGTPYTIKEILPNNSLLLDDPSNTLPTTTTNNISYTLKRDTGTSVVSGTTGSLTTTRRAKVRINDSGITEVRNILKVGDYLLYLTNQYPIVGFVSGEEKEFYIGNYILGDVAGVGGTLYKRLADNQIGFFDYKGLKLQTLVDHEALLGINNGANPPSEDNVLEDNHFKENYLIFIGSDYYFITEIDGITITLGGPKNSWKTLTALGTPVTYTINRYTKNQVTIDGETLDFIDRRGKEIITSTTESTMPFMVSTLNSSGNEFVESISQSEGISFTIEYADGSTETGQI